MFFSSVNVFQIKVKGQIHIRSATKSRIRPGSILWLNVALEIFKLNNKNVTDATKILIKISASVRIVN